jgi:hypothetical protein
VSFVVILTAALQKSPTQFVMSRKLQEMPPVELLRERLDYNPETGELRWKVHRSPQRVGAIATHATGAGYHRLKINCKQYYAHRIIWGLHTGEDLPQGMVIDHINHDPGDNRLVNLRLVSYSENTYNTTQNNNLTPDISRKGLTGAGGDRWRVQISVGGKKIYCGTYDTISEAIAARKKAEELRGYGY